MWGGFLLKRAVLGLALALGMAGCIESFQRAGDGNGTPETNSVDPLPANTASNQRDPQPEPEPEKIHVSGRTPASVCVMSAAPTCPLRGEAGLNANLDIKHRSEQCRAAFALAWNATSPLTKELKLTIQLWNREGDVINFTTVTQQSPLNADFALDGALDWQVLVTTNHRERLPVAADVIAETPQDFTLNIALFEGNACASAPHIPAPARMASPS